MRKPFSDRTKIPRSSTLSGSEFLAYRDARAINTVVGAALTVILPLGKYDDDKLLNLGNNRFAVTPQLGVVHTRGHWSYELTGSVSFFTDNSDFLIDQTREQDPIYDEPTHVISEPLDFFSLEQFVRGVRFVRRRS